MRSELEEALPRESEPLHLTLLDSLPDGVWFADRQGIIRFWSKRAEEITGFSVNEVLGAPFGDMLSYCGETGEPAALAPLRETLDDRLERQAHMFLRHKQGHRIAVEVHTMPVRSVTGEVIGAREILRERKDMPALVRRGRVLDQYGLWDAKIESASQEFMRQQLESRLEHFREDGIAAGALLIAIDRLGDRDRKLGREARDQLLRMVSRTTLLCIRFTDISGRWEEDSILAIMEASAIGNLTIAAERIRALISASSFRWWGELVQITVTIGCAMFQTGDTETLVTDRLANSVEAGAKAGGHRVLVA
jgi:PAS domain S-box-containing protein/diguanylate cyclase (GGDEF)-like protein